MGGAPGDVCFVPIADIARLFLLLISPNDPLQRQTKREGYPMQARIWIGILIGSTIGGFIPDLWGAGLFSYWSVLLSGFGAFVGLLIGYKLA
jgi:predicted MFS family arabinose efflux permease